MRKWIVVGLVLSSLAACAPYPYYYRDGYYRDGYYGHSYYRGSYSDRDRRYYSGDGRYYDRDYDDR